MSEPKTRIERRFVEGKGWEVREVPVDAPAVPGAVHVKPGAKGPTAPAVLILSDLPLQALIDEIVARGRVVVEADDYREMQERITELERQIDHAANGGTLPENPVSLPTADGKKAEPASPAEIKAAIAAAQSLDELTELMKTVTDKKLLALADKKAEELKDGGPQA